MDTTEEVIVDDPEEQFIYVRWVPIEDIEQICYTAASQKFCFDAYQLIKNSTDEAYKQKLQDEILKIKNHELEFNEWVDMEAYITKLLIA